nr:dihydrofolate reductase family protein [uncultured Mucilaginibacter sp.]
MRKVIYATNITIDGCCDHTKGIADEELHEYFTELLSGMGLLAYGRKTYELMVPFWPEVAKNQSMGKTSNEFARVFDSIPKLVFSQTLESVDDKNSTLSRAKPEEEILKLKQDEGKPISLGGVALSSHLIALGLVDEYHFVVQPFIAGEGTRLLRGINLPQALGLKLVDSKIFKSGCVALHYVKQ